MRAAEATDYLAFEAALVSGLRAIGRQLHEQACDITLLGAGRVAEILAAYGLRVKDVDLAAEARPGWVNDQIRSGWILQAADSADDIGDEDRCRYHDVLAADFEAWSLTQERL